MTARSELADQLTAALPDKWDVRPYFDTPTEIEVDRPVLMLWRDTLAPGPSLGTRSHRFAAWVLSPLTDPGAVDDDLDTLLTELVDVVDTMPTVSWTEAERSVLADTFQGYRILFTFYTNREAS